GGLFDHLAVLVGRAQTHVDDDLVEGRRLHRIGQAQIVHELLGDLLVVLLFEARDRHRSPPHFLQTRCLTPLSSTRTPIRVGPQSSHTTITLETSMGMSRSMIPPCIVWPRAFSCRLAVFTPSTMTVPLRGNTRETRDSLPLSLPAMTTTLSPSWMRDFRLPTSDFR